MGMGTDKTLRGMDVYETDRVIPGISAVPPVNALRSVASGSICVTWKVPPYGHMAVAYRNAGDTGWRVLELQPDLKENRYLDVAPENVVPLVRQMYLTARDRYTDARQKRRERLYSVLALLGTLMAFYAVFMLIYSYAASN